MKLILRILVTGFIVLWFPFWLIWPFLIPEQYNSLTALVSAGIICALILIPLIIVGFKMAWDEAGRIVGIICGGK